VDRHMKERLIGACILVVLVVAVVPELLSGPKPVPPGGSASASDTVRLPAGAPDPVRNVTVDLATSKPAVADPAVAPTAPQFTAEGGAANNPPSAPPTVSADPAPVGTAPVSTAPVSTAPLSTAPVSTAPLSTAPLNTGSPPISGQAFTVQLGSFANRNNAEKLVHQLKAQGFSIYMNAEGSGAAARYRVRVGPLADRDAAERTIAKLKGLGHAATIVSPR
jgi:DedD protein